MDLKDFVSVAICMHNGGRYIAAALESVFAQSYPHFEVVLVDDGSTDGAADEVQRRFRGERLTIVRQPQQTLRVARPVAVAHARGDLIAFLDHDDVWAPDKLARQVELARESGAALLFSDCLAIDAEGRTIGRLSDQFDLASIDLRHGHRELLRRGNFVAYSTAMVRADAIRAAGGFDGRSVSGTSTGSDDTVPRCAPRSECFAIRHACATTFAIASCRGRSNRRRARCGISSTACVVFCAAGEPERRRRSGSMGRRSARSTTA